MDDIRRRKLRTFGVSNARDAVPLPRQFSAHPPMKLRLLAPALALMSASNLVVAAPPVEITFAGDLTKSPIAAGVALPAGRAVFMTSGTVPPMLNKDATDAHGRLGDTKTQAIGTLKQIETLLAKEGLTLKDVIYLRVYVTADKQKENTFDYKGWFEAYGQFFGTAANPTKPARSTVGVAGLVSPDWLIEIEAVAVYPKL